MDSRNRSQFKFESIFSPAPGTVSNDTSYRYTCTHIYIYIFIGWRPGVGNLSSGNKFALTFIRYGLQFGDTHTHIYIIKRERRKKENGVKFVVDYRERYYINRFELRFVSGSSRRLDAARTMRSRRVSNGS